MNNTEYIPLFTIKRTILDNQQRKGKTVRISRRRSDENLGETEDQRDLILHGLHTLNLRYGIARLQRVIQACKLNGQPHDCADASQTVRLATDLHSEVLGNIRSETDETRHLETRREVRARWFGHGQGCRKITITVAVLAVLSTVAKFLVLALRR